MSSQKIPPRRSRFRGQRGATLVEKAIIIALIALIVLAAIPWIAVSAMRKSCQAGHMVTRDKVEQISEYATVNGGCQKREDAFFGKYYKGIHGF